MDNIIIDTMDNIIIDTMDNIIIDTMDSIIIDTTNWPGISSNPNQQKLSSSALQSSSLKSKGSKASRKFNDDSEFVELGKLHKRSRIERQRRSKDHCPSQKQFARSALSMYEWDSTSQRGLCRHLRYPFDTS